ncbi:hypothetical protein HBB16_13750 [Pseudonocardia sp. MCCB 268]|nr:hypothetical protein [Pseudonocardia cytotoxica]
MTTTTELPTLPEIHPVSAEVTAGDRPPGHHPLPTWSASARLPTEGPAAGLHRESLGCANCARRRRLRAGQADAHRVARPELGHRHRLQRHAPRHQPFETHRR